MIPRLYRYIPGFRSLYMLTVGPQLSRLLSSNSSARRERRLRGAGLGGAAGLGLLGLAQHRQPRIQWSSFSSQIVIWGYLGYCSWWHFVTNNELKQREWLYLGYCSLWHFVTNLYTMMNFNNANDFSNHEAGAKKPWIECGLHVNPAQNLFLHCPQSFVMSLPSQKH